MCAFQCDSCFHKQVCSDEPNTRALNEECALYANVKKFTDVQQANTAIAVLKNAIESLTFGNVREQLLIRLEAVQQQQ